MKRLIQPFLTLLLLIMVALVPTAVAEEPCVNNTNITPFHSSNSPPVIDPLVIRDSSDETIIAPEDEIFIEEEDNPPIYSDEETSSGSIYSTPEHAEFREEENISLNEISVSSPLSTQTDTVGSEWRQITSAAGWSARTGHTAVSHNGFIWVLGGVDNYFNAPWKNDVWRTVDGVTWTEVTSAAGWERRDRHATVSHDGYLWVLGGWDR